MASLNNLNLKEIAKLHRERGGKYTWSEIVNLLSLNIPSEALRKRVQRFERAANERSNSFLYGNDDLAGVVNSFIKFVPNKPPPDIDLDYDEPFDDGYDYTQGDYDFSNNTDADDFTVEHDRRNADSVYIDPEIYALRKQNLELKRLLDASGLNRDPQELMYDPYPPHLDDTSKWLEWQQHITQKKEVITLMFWSDMHIPDHSSSAIKLAENLLRVAQPDILVHGGDMFDFDALSTFAKSRRRRFRDAIMEVSGTWENVTNRIQKIAPNIKQVAFRGNHDSRIDRWNDMAANPFADTTEESFVQMIRSGDKVWWLGQYQETHVDTLFVQHGKKVGENAAKAAAKDQGWGTSLIQGHNHRPALFVSRLNDQRNIANYRVIMSASAGALCNIPPHYQMDTRQTAWLHGIVMAHINVTEGAVNLQPIVFHKNSSTGQLWTSFGSEVVTE